MYIVIIMMEVQYAIVVYNVNQRFCRLNKNLENIFNGGRITDQFKKDLGLGNTHSLLWLSIQNYFSKQIKKKIQQIR